MQEIVKGLKQILYRTFDEEGIRVKQMSKMTISFNTDNHKFRSNEQGTYIPINTTFNLSDEDYCQIVIDYIYDTTSVNIKSFNNLDQFISIDNLPFLLKLNEYDYENTIFSLAFGKIPGSFTIRKEHKIQSLGNIVEINGTLGITGASLKSFGKLKKVSGSLWISYAEPETILTDLNDIEEIGGSLLLRYYPIRDLNKLKSVGGILNLRSTNIESLGALKFVGGHLYLPKSKEGLFDLSKIEIIGKVKYFKT